jgi:hypothetical protein
MSSSNAGYTPLIIAIKERNVGTVQQLLEKGADANEKDVREKWIPMKWATYVYQYSPGHDNADNQEKMHKIVELLYNAKARNDFDSRTREDSYDFSPLIKEEVYDSEKEEYDNANYGGRRKRKTRKTKITRKSRKTKKSQKKGKRGSSTKRRKHMKK